MGTTPVAIAVNPVTNKAYVACSGDGTVWVINEAQGGTKKIAVGGKPQAIIVNPVTNKIYVANSNGSVGFVSVIDGTTDTSPFSIPAVGKNPFAIALNPVTNRIYVLDDNGGGNGTVFVINGSTDSLVGSPIGIGSIS